MSYIDAGIRYINERRHECGCLTRFDVVGWCSVVVQPCALHAQPTDEASE